MLSKRSKGGALCVVALERMPQLFGYFLIPHKYAPLSSLFLVVWNQYLQNAQKFSVQVV